jgi:ubiquinol-cytochrome c reductase cytochrome c1 subunit
MNMKKLWVCVAFIPVLLWGATEGVTLQKAPIDLRDTESLQRGAHIFMNYCFSCHSAQAMRYNRLQDIGLSEQQIKEYLLPEGAKIGDTMTINMVREDASAWLGAPPPDLSVNARANGADWLYTYLQSFYKDNSRPTGWNNKIFDKVAMPHVLWEWQGEQELRDGQLFLVKKGTLSSQEYQSRVKDLVNFLVYMGEPHQVERERLGYLILLFLCVVFLPIAYLLKREYWKDVH